MIADFFVMWKFLLKISGVLLTGLLWYLQEVPQNSLEWYNQFLNKYKINIALVALIVTIAAMVIDAYVDYRRQRSAIERWANSFLKHIVDVHLSGGNYETRISILRPYKGYKLILPYLFVYPFKAIIKEHHKIKGKAYWKNFPYKVFDDYLSIYARYGHSHRFHSYTHFLITDRRGKKNGLAVKCYNEEIAQEVCTVSLAGVELPKYYNRADRRVKNYMRDSSIDEKFYSTLLSMNTIANNLYAVPIFYESQKIWGVMMIDNDSDRHIHYKAALDPYISQYQNIFSYTLQILK